MTASCKYKSSSWAVAGLVHESLEASFSCRKREPLSLNSPLSQDVLLLIAVRMTSFSQIAVRRGHGPCLEPSASPSFRIALVADAARTGGSTPHHTTAEAQIGRRNAVLGLSTALTSLLTAAPLPANAIQGSIAGRIPGITGPDADGFYTYTRPEGKSGKYSCMIRKRTSSFESIHVPRGFAIHSLFF